MKIPPKIIPPDGELFWSNYDATLLLKINEILEYLAAKSPDKVEREACEHLSITTTKNGRFFCRDCKRFVKGSL